MTMRIARCAAVLAAVAATAGGLRIPAGVPSVRAAAAGLPAGGGFAIVPGQSSVTFAVPDTRGGFSGHTTRVTGRVDVEPAGDAYTATISAAVDARTLTTDNTIRDRAMHATFLQTATYPTIAFAGTATAQPGLGVRAFPAAVRGRLTIRDVARDTEFRASVAAPSVDQYVADATATVRMADYGIPYPRFLFFVARDPVTVTLHIVARTP